MTDVKWSDNWDTKEAYGIDPSLEKLEGWKVGDRFSLIEDAEEEAGAYEGESGTILGLGQRKAGMFHEAGPMLVVLFDDQEDPATISPFKIGEEGEGSDW